LSYENVKLWFAKNEKGDLLTINEIDEDNKNQTLFCPICTSNLKPKAVQSKRVTPHFAHVDADKCNSETMIHWWFKNKFLEKGDKFTVVSDELNEYVCKDILVEYPHKTSEGTYKPDMTIVTENNKTIYFEFNYSNKKKVKDYLDVWLELNNIVVEVDVKQLMLKDEIPKFNSLFYRGKCFNTKRNDTYYNTIGKYKEEKMNGKFDEKLKERIKKLDWFWDDMLRFKKGEIDATDLTELVRHIDIQEKFIVYDIVKRNRCNELTELKEYLKREKKKYKKIQRFYPSLRGNNDHPINVAISNLNTFFKNKDKGYRIVLDSHSVRRKKYRYSWRGAKIGYWSTDYYHYRVRMDHKLDNDSGYIFDITEYIVELDNPNLIFDYFYESFKNYQINIDCCECKSRFDLPVEEVEFYKSMKFSLPKRCKSCRKKRKQQKER